MINTKLRENLIRMWSDLFNGAPVSQLLLQNCCLFEFSSTDLQAVIHDYL